MSGMRQRTGSLELIRRSGSTARVYNLALIKERFAEDEDYLAKPLFANRRLNGSIIVKHSPRANERENFGLAGTVVTKIIFPFAHDALGLGGQSVFFEQRNFHAALNDIIGGVGTPEMERDLSVLGELTSLPSFDPYLLREKLARMNLDVARRYFEISEADAARMRGHVSDEIKRLVELAFPSDGADTSALSDRLATIFLNDETSAALEPFRNTMRLSPEEYRDGMFGWKGFLYYKWQARSLQASLSPIAEEILSVRVLRATNDDKAFLDGVRQRIVEALGVKAARVKQAITGYDKAFDQLVSAGNPNAFRGFLLSAPKMFMRTGEHLANLQHISSFWRFRFKPGAPRTMELDEAYDLFQEFESSLGGAEQVRAA